MFAVAVLASKSVPLFDSLNTDEPAWHSFVDKWCVTPPAEGIAMVVLVFHYQLSLCLQQLCVFSQRIHQQYIVKCQHLQWQAVDIGILSTE
jgi:hypothetical protein